MRSGTDRREKNSLGFCLSVRMSVGLRVDQFFDDITAVFIGASYGKRNPLVFLAEGQKRFVDLLGSGVATRTLQGKDGSDCCQ